MGVREAEVTSCQGGLGVFVSRGEDRVNDLECHANCLRERLDRLEAMLPVAMIEARIAIEKGEKPPDLKNIANEIFQKTGNSGEALSSCRRACVSRNVISDEDVPRACTLQVLAKKEKHLRKKIYEMEAKEEQYIKALADAEENMSVAGVQKLCVATCPGTGNETVREYQRSCQPTMCQDPVSRRVRELEASSKKIRLNLKNLEIQRAELSCEATALTEELRSTQKCLGEVHQRVLGTSSSSVTSIAENSSLDDLEANVRPCCTKILAGGNATKVPRDPDALRVLAGQFKEAYEKAEYEGLPSDAREPIKKAADRLRALSNVDPTDCPCGQARKCDSCIVCSCAEWERDLEGGGDDEDETSTESDETRRNVIESGTARDCRCGCNETSSKSACPCGCDEHQNQRYNVCPCSCDQTVDTDVYFLSDASTINVDQSGEHRKDPKTCETCSCVCTFCASIENHENLREIETHETCRSMSLETSMVQDPVVCTCSSLPDAPPEIRKVCNVEKLREGLENLKNRNHLLRDYLKNCGCLSHLNEANLSPPKTNIRQCPEFGRNCPTKTTSGLMCTVLQLQNKCRTKDGMIVALADELKKGATPEQTSRIMECLADPSLCSRATDFDRSELWNYLKKSSGSRRPGVSGGPICQRDLLIGLTVLFIILVSCAMHTISSMPSYLQFVFESVRFLLTHLSEKIVQLAETFGQFYQWMFFARILQYFRALSSYWNVMVRLVNSSNIVGQLIILPNMLLSYLVRVLRIPLTIVTFCFSIPRLLTCSLSSLVELLTVFMKIIFFPLFYSQHSVTVVGHLRNLIYLPFYVISCAFVHIGSGLRCGFGLPAQLIVSIWTSLSRVFYIIFSCLSKLNIFAWICDQLDRTPNLGLRNNLQQALEDSPEDEPTCYCPSNMIKPEPPRELIIQSRVSGDGLIVSWLPPIRGPVTGYEVLAEGEIVARIRSPIRTEAFIGGLDLSNMVLLEVRTVNRKGVCSAAIEKLFNPARPIPTKLPTQC